MFELMVLVLVLMLVVAVDVVEMVHQFAVEYVAID
jgi:hypothetical protein